MKHVGDKDLVARRQWEQEGHYEVIGFLGRIVETSRMATGGLLRKGGKRGRDGEYLACDSLQQSSPIAGRSLVNHGQNEQIADSLGGESSTVGKRFMTMRQTRAAVVSVELCGIAPLTSDWLEKLILRSYL